MNPLPIVCFDTALELYKTPSLKIPDSTLNAKDAQWYLRNAARCRLRTQVEETVLCSYHLSQAHKPLHLLLDGSANADTRTKNELAVFHRWSQPLEEGALLYMPDDYLLSSPAFCYLQMAATMTIPQLTKLGFLFCGDISTHGDEDDDFDGRNYFDREPIVAPESLLDFAERYPSAKGGRKAREAARVLLPGAHSPKEAELCTAVFLPRRHGGAGLPPGELNFELQIPKELRGQTSRKALRPDIYWHEHKLAVEYNGFRDHSKMVQVARDSSKLSLYKKMGIECVVITYYELISEDTFEGKIKEIEKRLKMRRRPLPPKWQLKRTELLDDLFPERDKSLWRLRCEGGL